MHVFLASCLCPSRMISQRIGRRYHSNSLLRKMSTFSRTSSSHFKKETYNKNNHSKSPNLTMTGIYLSTILFRKKKKREESLELYHRGWGGVVKEENAIFLENFFPNIFLRVSSNKMHGVCFSAENLYQNTACNGRIASTPFLIKQITINNILG